MTARCVYPSCDSPTGATQMFRSFSLPIVLAIGIAASPLTQAQQQAKPIVATGEAKSTAAPAAPDTGAQAMRDAVSAVVVVALTEQFSGKDIAVEFGDYAVRVASARERYVSGHGTVRIQGKGKGDAVGFSYRSIYDVVNGQAGYPSISITGVGGGTERMVPNDSGLIDMLDAHVASTISHDLGGKQVWLQLNRIDSYESGDRYMRIDADGIADFGIDGRSNLRIEALYDLGKKAWLRVNYRLDGDPEAGLQGGATQPGNE